MIKIQRIHLKDTKTNKGKKTISSAINNKKMNLILKKVLTKNKTKKRKSSLKVFLVKLKILLVLVKVKKKSKKKETRKQKKKKKCTEK